MMANSQIGPSDMMLDDLVPQPSDPEHMMVEFDQPQEPDYLLVGFDEPGLTPCFSQFNLNPFLLQGLSEATDITAPTQLQSDFLWLILGRPFKNLVLVSPMGSGKTMCALLAVLKRVNTAKLATQSIIVCPSGELSEQIIALLQKIGKYTGLQVQAAASNLALANRELITSHVVVGTPGIIHKLILAKKLLTASLKLLVYDDADDILSQPQGGFTDNSLRILMTTFKRTLSQVLMFSCTYDAKMESFVSRSENRVPNMEKFCFYRNKQKQNLYGLKKFQCKMDVCDTRAKLRVIVQVIMEDPKNASNTLIYVSSQNVASEMCGALESVGLMVKLFSKRFTKEETDIVITEVQQQLVDVLICTDSYCDVFEKSQIRLVINLDVPENAEIYSKRMAGVGGENGGGVVFSLCGGVMERERMSLIEDEMDLLVDDVTWMGEEELEHLARTWYKRRSPAW